METVLSKLVEYGILGILCAVLLYLVVRLQDKFIVIVQNNTNAFHELKSIIDKCQYRHHAEE